jgi:hypothetical protein
MLNFENLSILSFIFLSAVKGDVISELTDLECIVSTTKINVVNLFQ